MAKTMALTGLGMELVTKHCCIADVTSSSSSSQLCLKNQEVKHSIPEVLLFGIVNNNGLIASEENEDDITIFTETWQR